MKNFPGIVDEAQRCGTFLQQGRKNGGAESNHQNHQISQNSHRFTSSKILRFMLSFCFQKITSGTEFAVRELQGTEELEHKPTMTYRIDRVVVAEDYVILRISGRITGEDLNVLRTLLEQEGRAVAIDLKDILLVDREAVKLLALHESNGTEIRNCPLYIREWITREREATNR